MHDISVRHNRNDGNTNVVFTKGLILIISQDEPSLIILLKKIGYVHFFMFRCIFIRGVRILFNNSLINFIICGC